MEVRQGKGEDGEDRTGGRVVARSEIGRSWVREMSRDV